MHRVRFGALSPSNELKSFFTLMVGILLQKKTRRKAPEGVKEAHSCFNHIQLHDQINLALPPSYYMCRSRIS
jgi:hypothetical protein